MTSQAKLVNYHELADALLLLSDGGFRKQELKTYVVLERKLGKSNMNKNVVSVIRKGVSFMLSDWTAENEAKSLGLRAERSKTFPRLMFPNLTLSDIRSHSDFFIKLIHEAQVTAEHLQQTGVH